MEFVRGGRERSWKNLLQEHYNPRCGKCDDMSGAEKMAVNDGYTAGRLPSRNIASALPGRADGVCRDLGSRPGSGANQGDLPLRGTGTRRRGSVVDLFCGVGGLSHGFYLEGYEISAGVDTDEACRFAFEHNNDSTFICKSVSDLVAEEVAAEFFPGEPRILIGCAPCQPFSKYSQGRDDPRWSLLVDFARIIAETCPDIVSMENVPRLRRFRSGAVFADFVHVLESNGYEVSHSVAFCPDFGIPQYRSRLVLLASRHGPIGPIEKTHGPESYVTVRDAIGSLPALKAGEADHSDPLHRSSRLSDTNLSRIRASRPDGTWRDWPDDLVTSCHKRRSGRSYSSVYGRMAWSKPAPTMTTQFYGYGNGRFGHPEQDRAISLREGAILQTFPQDYAFIAPGQEVRSKTVGKLVGNAVPVVLARAIARAVAVHLEEHGL